MGGMPEDRASEEERIPAIRRKRMAYLCVGTCSLLVLGLVYAWSIFAVPLQEAFGWDRSALSHTFSISMASFCVGALAGSFLIRRGSTKLALCAAAILQALGFLGTAALAGMGIGAVYACYGILAGFGCGIGYNAVVSTVNLWFPDRIGLSAGVLLMGYGLGSLVLGTAANAAMEAFGWSAVFVAIGLASAAILIFLSAFLRLPPSDIDALLGKGAPGKVRKRVEVSDREMIQTPEFHAYFLWAVLLVSAAFTLTGDSKQGALAVGVEPLAATLLVGFVSLSNGLARVFFGFFFDKAGLKATMLLDTVVGTMAIGLLALSFAFGLPALYYVAALMSGFAGGGAAVMAPSFARERFPASRYARNLATINFNMAFSALLSSVVVSLGRPLGGDVAVYSILFAVMIAAFACALVFTRLYGKTGKQG